jgi:hypothetical protein
VGQHHPRGPTSGSSAAEQSADNRPTPGSIPAPTTSLLLGSLVRPKPPAHNGVIAGSNPARATRTISSVAEHRTVDAKTRVRFSYRPPVSRPRSSTGRAPHYECGGCRFNSCRGCQFRIGSSKVEPRTLNALVVGSSPTRSPISDRERKAREVRQRTFNPPATGSTPARSPICARSSMDERRFPKPKIASSTLAGRAKLLWSTGWAPRF